MRAILSTATILLAAVLIPLTACSTNEPGVRNTLGTVHTSVKANPPQVAAAAEAVLKELELIRVHSTFTEVDGQAFGYTAADKKVSVSIEQEGDNLSQVKVRVGLAGDEDLAVAIVTKIEEHLGVEPSK